jgi:hypothetical protein
VYVVSAPKKSSATRLPKRLPLSSSISGKDAPGTTTSGLTPGA